MTCPCGPGFPLRPILPLAVLGSLLLSCSSLRVPVHAPDFRVEEFLRVNQDGIAVQVRPIENQENYWELFDDDLPRAGIACMWVRIQNSTNDLIDLSGLRFELRAGTKTFQELNTRAVLKQFYRGRHIRMYSLAADSK